MISDNTKVLLLCALMITCVLSIFSSSSFNLGDSQLPTLNPPINILCSINKHLKHRNCDNEQCLREKCKSSVTSAYRDINMNGCLHQIVAEVVCRSLCDGKECLEECGPITKKLKECTTKHVAKYMKRAGFEEAEKEA
mmetsp:Transcript_37770/g.44008  ORF Transcript_37770/g.44008 Transcript_37770/m.44008 type:complete len:138 (-) Transcript_37770:374-787(-)